MSSYICMCVVYICACAVLADGKIFGWEYISRGAFHDGKISRLSPALYLGICRIARRHILVRV